MDHFEAEFEDLMTEAYGLPNGAAKMALLERAAELADLAGNIEAGYEAREEIVEVGSFGGFPLKAIVAYSWQLGQYDRNPEAYEAHTLHWNYKWVIDDVPSFPDVPAQQIESLLEDLRRRYREYGVSDRTYWYYRFRISMYMGDLDKAGEYLNEFRKLKRDAMSDCSACELDEQVRYLLLTGQDEAAVKKAQPIVKGRQRCAHVPHATLPFLLLPLHRLGRTEEADKLQPESYKLIRDNLTFVHEFGEHIGYLSIVDPQKALPLLERHLPQVEGHEDPLNRMMFYWNAAALLQKLIRTGETFVLNLPPSSRFYDLADNHDELRHKLETEAFAIAQSLDTRNANTYYTEYGKELLKERG
ncbi:hypothetical protein [Saccharibacillus endophyticus]|uniref:DUF4034 domain-containing protein n=1 Tax=Saccharibacillus endophyticus TaxID=2060666 RepID=A0ABQ1ZYZ7_9BACL|nr:hypothetical protein [Saccharibacillus endophyticus]GGH80905.1 hypothetical protein GCM10007362_29930 [Saccharibacillus endophyticus]